MKKRSRKKGENILYLIVEKYTTIPRKVLKKGIWNYAFYWFYQNERTKWYNFRKLKTALQQFILYTLYSLRLILVLLYFVFESHQILLTSPALTHKAICIFPGWVRWLFFFSNFDIENKDVNKISLMELCPFWYPSALHGSKGCYGDFYNFMGFDELTTVWGLHYSFS